MLKEKKNYYENWSSKNEGKENKSVIKVRSRV